MKPKFCLAILLLLAVTICSATTVQADQARSTYALIADGCVLYRTQSTSSSIDNVYCTLPSSYFVEVLEQSDTLCRVRYLDIEGYASIDGLEIVDYIPVTAYPSSGILAVDNDGLGLNMRSLPKKTAPQLAFLNEHTRLNLLGTTTGEERKAGGGTLWYFARYADEYGYVYAADVTVEQSIEPNVIAAIPQPDLAPPPPAINKTVETIVTIALIIPALFIVLLLFTRKQPAVKSP